MAFFNFSDITNGSFWSPLAPKGAKACGLFEKPKITDIKSFGMPSGHAQMAGFFTAYSMSKLGEDNVSPSFYTSVGVIIGSSLIFIMYRYPI